MTEIFWSSRNYCFIWNNKTCCTTIGNKDWNDSEQATQTVSQRWTCTAGQNTHQKLEAVASTRYL